MYKVIEHSWEYTSIVGRSGKTLCRFSIHDLGRVTENNQGNLESVQQERVSMVLNSINSHAALVEALERILEWDETGCDISRSAIENARIVLSQAKGGA